MREIVLNLELLNVFLTLCLRLLQGTGQIINVYEVLGNNRDFNLL